MQSLWGRWSWGSPPTESNWGCLRLSARDVSAFGGAAVVGLQDRTQCSTKTATRPRTVKEGLRLNHQLLRTISINSPLKVDLSTSFCGHFRLSSKTSTFSLFWNRPKNSLAPFHTSQKVEKWWLPRRSSEMSGEKLSHHILVHFSSLSQYSQRRRFITKTSGRPYIG